MPPALFRLLEAIDAPMTTLFTLLTPLHADAEAALMAAAFINVTAARLFLTAFFPLPQLAKWALQRVYLQLIYTRTRMGISRAPNDAQNTTTIYRLSRRRRFWRIEPHVIFITLTHYFDVEIQRRLLG